MPRDKPASGKRAFLQLETAICGHYLLKAPAWRRAGNAPRMDFFRIRC
ncbi:MAG: hypothetical protein V2I51_15950 [Anderseniella sp.]|jgi:hypothetical protein|nr:hypothetical protein [Anderseniella sp.]